jgi:hypothetical protein
MSERREILYPDSNRVGKFNLLYGLLEDGGARPMLQALLELCAVLEVGEHGSGRGKEYVAVSGLFQPLGEGEEIPEYRIEFACSTPFPNQEHEARRLNSGAFGFVAIRKTIVRAPAASLACRLAAPGQLYR